MTLHGLRHLDEWFARRAAGDAGGSGGRLTHLEITEEDRIRQSLSSVRLRAFARAGVRVLRARRGPARLPACLLVIAFAARADVVPQ